MTECNESQSENDESKNLFTSAYQQPGGTPESSNIPRKLSFMSEHPPLSRSYPSHNQHLQI
jgi:hypothetical protein